MATAILLKPGEGSLPLGEHGIRDMVACEDNTLALIPMYSSVVLRVTVSADGAGCTVSHMAGKRDEHGFADGDAERARFYYPWGLAALRGGRLAVVDKYNYRVREVSAEGVVTTFAGSGENKTEDGVGTKASFCYPEHLAVRRGGALLVSGSGRHAVRSIAPVTAKVTTVAGAAEGPGFVDGAAAEARFRYPAQMTALPGGATLVCDGGNNRLRLLSADGATVCTLAGSGEYASTDGIGTAAAFSDPGSVAADCAGRAIVVETIDNPAYDEYEDEAAYDRGEDYNVPEQLSALRLVDVRARAVTTVLGTDGDRLQFAGRAKVAIDGKGRVCVASYDGLHLVTGAGVGPGWFPWSPRWWKPTRAVHRWVGRHGKAAVMAVLLVATRSLRLQHAVAAAPVGAPASLLRTLPVLPLEMWHCVLSMIEVHELGAAGGDRPRPRAALAAEVEQLKRELAAAASDLRVANAEITGLRAANAEIPGLRAEVAGLRAENARLAAGE